MRNASTVATAVAPVEVAKMTSVRWKIFFAMLLLISINYIDRASLSVAMPLIAKEFNMDPAIAGAGLSAPSSGPTRSCRYRAACWPTGSSRGS